MRELKINLAVGARRVQSPNIDFASHPLFQAIAHLFACIIFVADGNFLNPAREVFDWFPSPKSQIDYLNYAVRDKAEDVGKANSRHGEICQVLFKTMRKGFGIEPYAPPPHYPEKEAGDVDRASNRHLDPERPGRHGRDYTLTPVGLTE